MLNFPRKYVIGLYAALVVAAYTVCSAPEAAAKLYGEAELNYISYNSEFNGTKEVSAHSFQHRYSLLYNTSADLDGGRLGGYSISLGYEWGAFSTTATSPNAVDNFDASGTRGHILYEGDILLDPKELPFRFHAYSHDMSRISFVRGYTESFAESHGGQLLPPDLITNVVDGERIESGATMVFGVRNGLTNGYNALFRYFPMVLLDYKDEITRDRKSYTPIDTRLSRFAFVSLNKRDNWFHFRSTRFSDYINPINNWIEQQFQIGTVDQYQQRRWIDLCNWIAISADGQFTQKRAANFVDSTEAYDLNLFAVASRLSWEARSYNTFHRAIEQNYLRYETNVPLYVTGVWGPETSWRARFWDRERRERPLNGILAVTDDQSDVSASLQVDAFKHSRFTLSPSLTVERNDMSAASTVAVNGRIETTSTRRFSDIYSVAASYALSYFTTDQNGGTTTYQNHYAVASVTYAPSQRYRLTFSENIQAAIGTNSGTAGGNVIQANPGFNNSISTNGNLFSVRSDAGVNDYIRYITTFGGTWHIIPRLDVSLNLTEDILTQPTQPTNFLTRVDNTLGYQRNSLNIRLTNSYIKQSGGGFDGWAFNSFGTASYTPNRNVDGSLNYNYLRQISGGIGTTIVTLGQKLGYYIYKTNGISRRLLEVVEEFRYDQNGNDIADITSSKTLTLSTRYYPLKYLFAGVSGSYLMRDPGAYTGYIASGQLGMNLRLMQINLDYSYGMLENTSRQVEKRFSASVRKSF